MASMDSHKKKGVDIEKEIGKGVDSIKEKGKDFQTVKDALKGMPGGLDQDLVNAIQNVEKQGKIEAQKDIDNTKSSVIDKAKASADTLKSDVNKKIGDNKTAKGKLEGISSKYGKDAISKAKSSIDSNTQKGQDIISNLDSAIKQADQDVQTVKGKL